MFISEYASEYLSRYESDFRSIYDFHKMCDIRVKEKKARGFYKKPRWNISVVAKEYIPYRTLIAEIDADIYMNHEDIDKPYFIHPELDIKIVVKDEILNKIRTQCRNNVTLKIIKAESTINKKNIENREKNKKYRIFLMATSNIMEDEELIINVNEISNSRCSCNKIDYCLHPNGKDEIQK